MTRVIASVLLFAMLAITSFAFPFSKNSGVVELTPKTLNGFLNTHKPVFIMFYAPWCGHCKSMHPDYEKFGKGMKDVVRVGAVNADQYKEIGGQFGIQGFPTIKYWKMGSKKGMKPMDYQGQRNRNGLHNAALAEITANVKIATNIKQVTESIDAATAGKAIVLFSSKNKSPPIFSVMSQSPHFKGKVSFVLVSEKTKEIVSHFGVEKFPSIMILSKGESEEGVKDVYDGPIDYTSIAKYLKSSLGEEVAETSTAEKKEEPAKEEKKEPVKNSRPATPVRPTKLTEENFQTFCAHGSPKVNGQQPFCVIKFGDADELNAMYDNFAHDAVLFFFTGSENALIYAEDLQGGLQPSPPLARDDVIALRAAKDRTKYKVWHAADDHLEETTTAFVERALAGEFTFDRHPFFPKLRKI